MWHTQYSSRTTNVFDFKNVFISRALANFICAEKLNDTVRIIDRKMIRFMGSELRGLKVSIYF